MLAFGCTVVPEPWGMETMIPPSAVRLTRAENGAGEPS
jgi:hypothetical protein